MGWKFASQWKFDKNWVHKFPSFASPLFYSTNLRWILAFSSSTFRAFSARTWRLRSLSSIQVSSDLSSYVLASFRRSMLKTSSRRRRMVPPDWCRSVAIPLALWRRAGRKREPLRDVRRNWDFGGRLSGPRVPNNLPPKSQFRRTAQTGSLFLPALRQRPGDTGQGSEVTHSSHKHASNLTQDLAPQPLLPLTPKRLSHSPSKKHATRDTALFTRRQCSEQKRKR